MQSQKTSFPSITLVVGSTLRRIWATSSLAALKTLQHRYGKHPSMRYSTPGLSYTSTATLVLDLPMIDDLFTLNTSLLPKERERNCTFETVPFLHHQLLLHSSLLSSPTENVSSGNGSLYICVTWVMSGMPLIPREWKLIYMWSVLMASRTKSMRRPSSFSMRHFLICEGRVNDNENGMKENFIDLGLPLLAQLKCETSAKTYYFQRLF